MVVNKARRTRLRDREGARLRSGNRRKTGVKRRSHTGIVRGSTLENCAAKHSSALLRRESVNYQQIPATERMGES